MIKVEYRGKEKIKGGIIDAQCEVSIVGSYGICALEFANLIVCISKNYPEVFDIAMKYVEDNKDILEE